MKFIKNLFFGRNFTDELNDWRKEVEKINRENKKNRQNTDKSIIFTYESNL